MRRKTITKAGVVEIPYLSFITEQWMLLIGYEPLGRSTFLRCLENGSSKIIVAQNVQKGDP